MTLQSATQKAADTAHSVAEDVLDSAKDAVQATRRAANTSLDKAEAGVEGLKSAVNPTIDDLAARAQELANRSITYCADASERARRQFNQAADATTRYVSDQPGKSMLIAAAAGAAFATLLFLTRGDSRRRGDY
ncbi:hypothetical protein [Paracidovorax wautersii]|uniref:Membrane-anchored ribosome-binding protein, inhibits growth in stationary phase, ElaB/YqjD/DUF883 family n=1 Tax=Paracidovorax wautersii TaxID=1177982 RepID=A0A1I2BRH7_9BURK|nr:hypothetical protein [Paracidovorax wautersii]SFE58766.1 hypothetical protein SAMN04489711_103159 [Paracidovorax wautersii]